jgi:hypothetical protein
VALVEAILAARAGNEAVVFTVVLAMEVTELPKLFLTCFPIDFGFFALSGATGVTDDFEVCSYSTAELGRWLEMTHWEQNFTSAGRP